VRQFVIKVLNIIDARCTREVFLNTSQKCYHLANVFSV